ncbi:hypothetical protein ZEAMMB73_Zm00001d013565 [Zea mays]|uniref:Uncharacterized protein n=1 Tax=Zea mays TaxID=4577 RepID=A0A1D6GKL4_MAIZE|nr:hypothetical protein ZEAMMB73_Zm00001d013565 [Zea mays]
MGHLFLLLVALLLLTSTRAAAAVHAKASVIEVSRQWQQPDNGYGGEFRWHQRRDRIQAADLRGEVQVLWPLRGSAGARISAAASEEEEGGSRPWQQQSCCCCCRWKSKSNAGLLLRPLQLQAPELAMQVWAAHPGPLKDETPALVDRNQSSAALVDIMY